MFDFMKDLSWLAPEASKFPLVFLAEPVTLTLSSIAVLWRSRTGS